MKKFIMSTIAAAREEGHIPINKLPSGPPNGEWYWVMGYWKRIPDNVFVASMPPEPSYNRPPQHWINGYWEWI
jgi:hypothetical protein